MAVKYFRNFPLIDYGNGDKQRLRNIMLNARITKELMEKNSDFYEYTIESGETPLTVAYDYYGSVDYAWLVLMANDIVDPYHGWHKSPEFFDEYLQAKYGSIQEAQALLLHYENPEADYKMTPETFSFASPAERTGWTPVYAYEYEEAKNEELRKIRLVSLEYAARIAADLEKILQ